MTLDLPEDLQYGLLEFISHVNAENFDALPEDFVKLGATPPDRLEDVRRSGISKGFAVIMRQLSKGGGPSKLTDGLRVEFKARYGDLSDSELSKRATEEMLSKRLQDENAVLGDENLSVDVSGMAGIMEMMSKRNRDIFKLPSYMLYVVRAFSTLEGIGLSINPSYSILQECYPYLAKRLMTDDSPRSEAALRNMIYQDGRLKVDKLLEFSEGFSSYTAVTADVDESEGSKAAQDALTDLLLDEQGNMMQDLLVEGAAKFADSLLRVGIDSIRSSPGGKLAEFAMKTPKTLVDMFVPNELKPLMLPFTLPYTLPYDISKALINLVDKDDTDIANVRSLRLLLKNVEPRVRQQLQQLVRDGERRDEILVPLSLVDSKTIRNALASSRMSERLPVFLRLTRKFGATVLNTAAQRLQSTARSTYTSTPSSTASTASPRVNHLSEDEEVEDLDYEIELLLTEQIGSLSSVTAKSIASVLDSSSNSVNNRGRSRSQ